MAMIWEELEALEIYNYERKTFVPYEALKSHLTLAKTETIVSELSRDGKIQVYQRQEILTSIHSNGLRLFATLLTFSRPELIVDFIKHDHFTRCQLDSRLPLQKSSLKPILKDDNLCNRFDKHQWKFIPPFFRIDQSHRELEDDARLPFEKCRRLGDGGFGEVYEMTLPASCQNLVPQKNSEVLNA